MASCSGDVVAVELLPEDQWKSDSAKLPEAAGAASERSGGAAGSDEEEEAEALGAEICQVRGDMSLKCQFTDIGI